MLLMLLIILYLLLMIQIYKFQLLLCQRKIIKILLNNKIKAFKDLFIRTNIKKEQIENADANVVKYINLDPSFQGVNRLFVMGYNREIRQPTSVEGTWTKCGTETKLLLNFYFCI